ncbi:MAG: hypothetical protein QOK49_2353 [Baekduia sp.]|nr:hypothetical protein [Baekduia sp.]
MALFAGAAEVAGAAVVGGTTVEAGAGVDAAAPVVDGRAEDAGVADEAAVDALGVAAPADTATSAVKAAQIMRTVARRWRIPRHTVTGPLVRVGP